MGDKFEFRTAAFGLTVLVLIAGCSKEPEDWQTAAEADTEAAYEAYLAEHADGEHAADAGARLRTIRGDRAWQELAGSHSAETLGAFLDTYPDHEATDEARFLFDVYTQAEALGGDAVRIIGAEIVSAEDGGIGLELDEPLDNPSIGMITTSIGLSTTRGLVFDPVDLVVGNHVQLYMAFIETELPQMTLKHWTPVGFAAD